MSWGPEMDKSEMEVNPSRAKVLARDGLALSTKGNVVILDSRRGLKKPHPEGGGSLKTSRRWLLPLLTA